MRQPGRCGSLGCCRWSGPCSSPPEGVPPCGGWGSTSPPEGEPPCAGSGSSSPPEEGASPQIPGTGCLPWGVPCPGGSWKTGSSSPPMGASSEMALGTGAVLPQQHQARGGQVGPHRAACRLMCSWVPLGLLAHCPLAAHPGALRASPPPVPCCPWTGSYWPPLWAPHFQVWAPQQRSASVTGLVRGRARRRQDRETAPRRGWGITSSGPWARGLTPSPSAWRGPRRGRAGCRGWRTPGRSQRCRHHGGCPCLLGCCHVEMQPSLGGAGSDELRMRDRGGIEAGRGPERPLRRTQGTGPAPASLASGARERGGPWGR